MVDNLTIVTIATRRLNFWLPDFYPQLIRLFLILPFILIKLIDHQGINCLININDNQLKLIIGLELERFHLLLHVHGFR